MNKPGDPSDGTPSDPHGLDGTATPAPEITIEMVEPADPPPAGGLSVRLAAVLAAMEAEDQAPQRRTTPPPVPVPPGSGGSPAPAPAPPAAEAFGSTPEALSQAGESGEVASDEDVEIVEAPQGQGEARARDLAEGRPPAIPGVRPTPGPFRLADAGRPMAAAPPPLPAGSPPPPAASGDLPRPAPPSSFAVPGSAPAAGDIRARKGTPPPMPAAEPARAGRPPGPPPVPAPAPPAAPPAPAPPAVPPVAAQPASPPAPAPPLTASVPVPAPPPAAGAPATSPASPAPNASAAAGSADGQPAAASGVPVALLPSGAGWSEALSQRPRKKRLKPWFEEVFDEDYLRTLPFMTPEQTLREVAFIKEALNPPHDGQILDVGCGYGRHAIELGQRGLRITGIDLSLPLLIRAADESQRRALNVNFVHADMREMAFDGQFDGAYCMLTTFGYFDEETNLRVASAVCRALKPGGRFLLDTINRDYVAAELPTRVWWEGDGCVVLEEVEFNFHTSRVMVRRSIVFQDGRQVEHEISIRAYSLHELGKLLRQAGFRVLEVSGSLATQGRFFGSTSRSIIMVCERPAG